MGSESLTSEFSNYFTWENKLNMGDYIEVSYYVETQVDPELVAVAMAKEQSSCTIKAPLTEGYDFAPYTARVTDIEYLRDSDEAMLPAYRLNTSIYNNGNRREKGYWCGVIKIAFPILNFNTSLTNLWNAIGGELHRLGFINAIRIIDITFPDNFLDKFSGPLHGIVGIKEKLCIKNRPIFCRSARPAVGLTTDMMLKINESVLRGGFDIIKDDELTISTPLSPFPERVKRMTNLCRRLEDETGERKYYIANITSDMNETFKLADIAMQNGVDALLVSPAIQGFSICSEISRRTGLAVLCHNSWVDVWTRHPRFGVTPAVFFKLQRICGADMLILPGDFATEYADNTEEKSCITACISDIGKIKNTLPIIAGGKSSEHLQEYVELFQNTDFMIIAASALDNHPDGIEAGARSFREAWKKVKLAKT